MKIAELREKRKTFLKKAREIHEQASTDKRMLSTSEQIRFDAAIEEARDLNEQIDLEIDRKLKEPLESEYRDISLTPAHSQEWKDRSGNPLYVLRNDQRMQDLPGQRAGENSGFDLGRAIKGIALGHWDVDSEREKRVMQIGLDSQGGYTVDSLISNQVIDLARSASVCIASGAGTLAMLNHTVDLVKVTADPSVAWYGEGATIADDTAATLGRLQLVSRKMAVKISLSRELLEDSPNGADIIRNMVINAMAQELDRVCLVGDGDNGEPVGLGTNADVIASQTSVGAFSNYDDFIDAQSLISAQNHAANAAIIHPLTRGALAKTKASTGGSYLIMPPLLDPIKFHTTTGVASTQAFVGDFKELLIGIRQGIQLNAIIDHDTLATDEIELLCRFRGDVGILRPTAFSHLSGITY